VLVSELSFTDGGTVVLLAAIVGMVVSGVSFVEIDTDALLAVLLAASIGYRKFSHAGHSINSPIDSLTDESFFPCGQAPSGSAPS